MARDLPKGRGRTHACHHKDTSNRNSIQPGWIPRFASSHFSLAQLSADRSGSHLGSCAHVMCSRITVWNGGHGDDKSQTAVDAHFVFELIANNKLAICSGGHRTENRYAETVHFVPIGRNVCRGRVTFWHFVTREKNVLNEGCWFLLRSICSEVFNNNLIRKLLARFFFGLQNQLCSISVYLGRQSNFSTKVAVLS